MSIRCRAKLGSFCLDGKPERSFYDVSQDEDGTWDGHTVVCTPCYAELLPYTATGQGRPWELHTAILMYRDMRLPVEERVQKFIIVNEGEPGSITVAREDREDGVHLKVLDGGIPEAEAVIADGKPIRWI